MGDPVKILFYGRLAEAIAPAIELGGSLECTVAQLRERLALDHPEAAETLAGKRSRACVGNTLVREDHVIRCGDQIEFLPPVSGG